MKLVKKLLIVTIIMVIMLSNNLIFATGQTDTNNSETNTGQVSNSSRIIVLDAGHGTEGPSEASGWINNGSEWGEWRHFKEGTYGQNCNGCNQPGTSQYGCWYPYNAGTRPEIEPTLTWKMTTAAQKYLQSKGYTVRLTKSSMAEDPSMTKRATYCFPGNDITKNPDAEIFVCIHSNAGGGTGSCYMNLDTSSGHYKQGYIPADYATRGNALGKSINDAIVSQTSLGAYSNGVYSGNENVILFHKNPVTTAYLEIGFYDDGSPDLPILQSESDKIGQAIADGIDSYLQGVTPSVNTGSTGGNGTASGAIEKGKITTQSNEDKFLGLWKNKVGKYVPYYEDPENAKFDPNGIRVVYPGYGAPVSSIFGGTDWFFSLLQESENAQYDENLMRYLMYKYTEGRTSYGVTEFDFSIFDIETFTSASTTMGDIPLYTPTLSKDDFMKAMQEFSDAGAGGAKSNFDSHFLSRAGDIYDWGVEYGINPELIVVFAYAEQSFRDPIGDESNFWGLGTPNGASSPSYGSFENGEKAMAERFEKYNAGAGTFQEELILQYYNERQGLNPNGCGQPGTLKGLLSVYTELLGLSEIHYDGDAGGTGGIPYLKEIYGSEFEAKCGSVHTVGVTPWTTQEYADASAYVYEQRRDMWTKIFGKYATIGGTGNNILDTAYECMKWLDDHDCVYILGGGHVPMEETDRGLDCTTFTSWVLYLTGYQEAGIVYTSYDLENNPKNWPKITNKADLQPGDILVYDGHGDIYVGPGSDGSNENTFVKYNAGWESWEAYAPEYKYEGAWREGYLFALRPTK